MTGPEACTPRGRVFLAALYALCAQYGVHLPPSGYATLQIWRVTLEDTGGFDWDAMEDCTQEDRIRGGIPGDGDRQVSLVWC